jgi:hypothetical protein
MPRFVPWLFEAFIERRITPQQRAMRSILAELTKVLDSWHHPEWNLRTHVSDDGVELEYRRVRRVFCRLEPRLFGVGGDKRAVVLVFVRGAAAAELEAAGEVLRSENNRTYGVVVSNKRGAKALAPLIRRAWKSAYDTRSSALEATGYPVPVAPWQQ